MSDEKQYNTHTCGEGPLADHVINAVQAILNGGPAPDCRDSYKALVIAAEVVRRAFNYESYDPLTDPTVAEMFGPLSFSVRSAWFEFLDKLEVENAMREVASVVVDDSTPAIDMGLSADTLGHLLEDHNHDDD